MTYKFWLKTDARFGSGVSMTAVDYIRQKGCKRVAVIIDAGLRKNEHAQHLVAAIRESTSATQVAENAVAEPDYDYLDEFRGQFSNQLDLFIGIGGGSTLDLAKAMSVLVTNPGPAISYRGFDLLKEPGVPLIAIPTTAGTGSETTPNAVFTDRREMRKFGINTELYVPRLALVDPLLTLSCPRSVTVSSGLDALVHTVESYVANGATPISRMYSREAFRLLMVHLPRVIEQPDDVQVRAALQLAAFYAATALMNSGSGTAGALSYPLGVHFKVPHGLAGGVFLAPVAAWNVKRGAFVYGELADLLPEPATAIHPIERAQAVCLALSALSRKLDVPTSLTHFGVKAEDVSNLVEEPFPWLEGSLRQNPVPMALADLRVFFESML